MTYLLLNGAFLTIVLVLTLVLLRGTRATGSGLGRWWTRTAVVFLALAVLTVIFDSIMIWADLFRFEDEHMSGLRIGLAPIEDLAWPLASALLLPALWAWLGRRDVAPASGRFGPPAGTAEEGTP